MSTTIASANNDRVTVNSYYSGRKSGIRYQVTWSNERGIQYLSFDDETTAINFYNLVLKSVEVNPNR